MDLDLGNYERYLLTRLTRDHNITTGKIYQRVLEQERIGHYLGKTVQVYVLFTNMLKSCTQLTVATASLTLPTLFRTGLYALPKFRWMNLERSPTFASSNWVRTMPNHLKHATDIRQGGTVGDIESAPFVHALSQLQRRAGKNNYAQIHVSYVPVIP